ncbi:helix-turn-helix domain-containing protein [Schinkia azotoformans]|uniref:helix-turn-helix domain-containing protein n=1 Tax=Schinkia azotoformans TaxID=1454 RepID=UPI002DBC0011|nr:helix-turn-helix domain-containing protein [Schinkia azotoformans]MEC1693945.1 helix-turn-helix domain-containing protein [Schinkia azotoformans]
METNLRTTKEISELLNVSEETVRRWIRNGDLDAHLDGKSYLVEEGTLKKFIQERAKVPGTTISKMAPLMGGALTAIIPHLGEILTRARAVAKSKSNGETLPEKLQEGTIDLKDIEVYIDALQRKKKKIELEYQMKLLEIEDEIAGFMVLKDKIENGEDNS